mgnify:CR=1 FL=1
MRPTQRVVADVALQVQKRFAGYIPQLITIDIKLDNITYVFRIVDEFLDLVLLRVPVNRNPVVPVVPIRRAVFVQWYLSFPIQ